MKKAIILISALTLSLAASAQTDSKNAVVNVENDYTPEVIEVVKKNFTPAEESKNKTKADPMELIFSKAGKAFNGFISERDIKDVAPQVLSQQFDNSCKMVLSIRKGDAPNLIERLKKVESLIIED